MAAQKRQDIGGVLGAAISPHGRASMRILDALCAASSITSPRNNIIIVTKAYLCAAGALRQPMAKTRFGNCFAPHGVALLPRRVASSSLEADIALKLQ